MSFGVFIFWVSNQKNNLLSRASSGTLRQKLKVLLSIFCGTKTSPALCLNRSCKFFQLFPIPPLFNILKYPYPPTPHPPRHLKDLIDEAGQAILSCDYNQEKKGWDQTNYSLYGIFDQGWYEFQLKYWRLCFGFCKIFVSRDLWCHQNWPVSCCSYWKFRWKKVP